MYKFDCSWYVQGLITTSIPAMIKAICNNSFHFFFCGYTSQLNRDLTRLTGTMISSQEKAGNLTRKKVDTPLKLPPLKPPKQDTSNPFPVVTSQEIGWRSSRPDCKLEIYGRWGRPKYTITKTFEWPNDAVP